MSKDTCTLTEAEEQQLHIRVASATWIEMLSTHPAAAGLPAKQRAADDFMAAQKDLLEKCAAAKKVFPLLWICTGRARFRPLRDRPLVGPSLIDRT
ncbi:MAG: hypothetical protein LIO42_03500 [Oscillospiraceae bacterium]|nr:hypothetical protein [Oscillospiraceae bacterium]